jgi:NTP pyrophosphatase (non-canonical NTP hydrolase)
VNKTELYQKAIDTWGIYSQTLVFHEEMAEVFEILKGISSGNLTEELADALIMVEQMAFNFGVELKTGLSLKGIICSKTALRELEIAYLLVNQFMSHTIRKRVTGILLEDSLNIFWNALAVMGHYNEIESSYIDEIKEQKLHRLASMLGVDYDEK